MSVITNKKQLQFAVDRLSAIVPYESVECLKVQMCVHFVEVMVARSRHDMSCYWCQAHLEVLSKLSDRCVTDYLHLVRTRLLDLNSVPNSDSNLEATSLVEESIAEYRSTGGLALQMIKTSIFLSPFFVGHVLPLLLSPSGADRDVRHALVKQLHK